MSDELFEVAFSGQISEGANLDDVKSKVGKIFNADEAKLALLFSGKRIVIKKNIDQATAAKYQVALGNAGAVCEIVAIGDATPAVQTQAAAPAPVAVPAEPVPDSAPSLTDYKTEYEGDVEPPPQTDPLGITGDQIEDLGVSIAPVGSELQDAHAEPEAPQLDISGLDVAPVGTNIAPTRKEQEPPLPDTSGITLAD